MTPSEQIKEKLDIVEFIKGYLELRPAGRNFKALCPFHTEKTPSFIISPDRQIWHCFGCGEGGDIFKFLMRHENLEFHEALTVLAEKAGVELKGMSAVDARQFGVLYDINNAAAILFEDYLAASPETLSYLQSRGLKKETISEFGLGLAPAKGDDLIVNLINRGFNINDIVRAGLAIRTERGQYRDRFERRIMFPIHNHFGKVVGFSGRILPNFEKEEVAKYLNTSETPIFNKSRILYGFWQSKKFIRDEEAVFLVEGQMDFLLTWQDGVKNVVASSGTALTADHLRLLRRSAKKLILGFDPDQAGLKAAERSIDLAGTYDFIVSLISFGGFSDPAEAARQKPGFLKDAIGRAKPAMEYYLDRYLTGTNSKTIEGKKTSIRLILSKIKNLWSPVERSHWLRELSYRSGIPETGLAAEMDQLSEDYGEITSTARTREEKKKLERRELVALQILGLIAIKNPLGLLVEPYISIMPPSYGEAYKFIIGEDTANSQQKSFNEEVQEIVNFASLRGGVEFSNFEEEQLELELKKLINELQYEHLKQLREETGRLVFLSEQSGKEEELMIHLKQLDEIVKKLHDLKNAKEVKEKIKKEEIKKVST